MGKKARVLNELLSHEGLRESLDYNEEQKRSNLECLHKTQERLHRQLEFRKKTLQEHPLLSDNTATTPNRNYDTMRHLP